MGRFVRFVPLQPPNIDKREVVVGGVLVEPPEVGNQAARLSLLQKIPDSCVSIYVLSTY